MVTGTLVKNRGIYFVEIRVRIEGEKVKRKLISTHVSVKNGLKRDASKAMTEILNEHKDDDKIDTTPLFSDYLSQWLEKNKKRLSQTTYDGYMHMFEKHIKPYFNINISKIDDDKISAYCIEKSGLNPNTVVKHLALIRTVLQNAIRDKFIDSNPVDIVNKPKRKKYVPNFYNAEKAKKLWATFKGTELELPVYFAIFLVYADQRHWE